MLRSHKMSPCATRRMKITDRLWLRRRLTSPRYPLINGHLWRRGPPIAPESLLEVTGDIAQPYNSQTLQLEALANPPRLSMDSSFNEILAPPLNTSFYKRKTFNVFDGRNFLGKTLFSVSWRVDAHIYATESPPTSPDYQGTVYIIFVHSATLVAPDPQTLPINDPTRFTVTPVDDSVRATALEPQSWTQTTGLDDFIRYSSVIDFAEDFQMFNNGGAQEFTFSAVYKETTMGNLKHSGRIVGHQTEFSFDEIIDRMYTEENFRAISVFSTTKATGSLEFRFALENENYNITTQPGIPIVIDLFPVAAP